MATQKQSDRFYVGGTASVAVPVVTDWVDVAGDFTSSNITATTDHLNGGTISYYRHRRVGGNLEVSFQITDTNGTTGTGGSGTDELIFKLPVVGLTPENPFEIVGVGAAQRVLSDIPEMNAGAWAATAIESRSTGLVLRRDETTWNSGNRIVLRDDVVSSGVIKFNASIPIAEWQPEVLVGTTVEATATEAGLVKAEKTYFDTGSGGGVTFGSDKALSAIHRGRFTPYQTLDGAWFLKFNVTFTTSNPQTSQILTITGVVFKNVASYQQACDSADASGRCQTVVGAATLELDSSSFSLHRISGDVELESKPTWAD